MNNSQIIVNLLLTQYMLKYNAKFEDSTKSDIAIFILVFGVIGFMLSVAFFAG